MPILHENKKLYPKNWKEISEYIRFVRAGNKCEVCGVRNHSVGYRDEKGIFIPLSGNIVAEDQGNGIDPLTGEMLSYKEAKEIADFHTQTDEMGYKYIVIVLTVAHLDHNPKNCEEENLKAMCQKCHNEYDRKHRNRTIKYKGNTNQLTINFKTK